MSFAETGDLESIGHGYLDHLTEHDLRLLGGPEVRSRPVEVLARLRRPEVVETLFPAQGRDTEPIVYASPFLTFAVAIERAAGELDGAAAVLEWTGPRQRLPVFDGARLAGFLAEPAHRLFLAELLGSYAHVSSGSYWTRTARGWRRRRWSELDPTRLAGLLEVVAPSERPGVLRRLGDLALFLTGVFPDHTALHELREIDATRLLHAAGASADPHGAGSTVALLERLGQRWYELAVSGAAMQTARLRTLQSVASRFDAARRVLNLVADRYLFGADRWFPMPWA